MALFAFQLGRKKKLCLAELIAVLGKDRLIETNLDTAIFNLETVTPENAQLLQNILGGTIKIIQLWISSAFSQTGRASSSLQPARSLPLAWQPIAKLDLELIQKQIESELKSRFENHSGKLQFSISILSFKDPKEVNIKKLLNFSKILFKSLQINSRFVNKNFLPPKPSTIYKARVLEKGIDLNIIKGTKEIYLGHSITIQDIDNYSYRDYEKPKRDAKVGMLPPKLAQIMINLAGSRTKTIYDPFCGTGTVLTEGLLMGKNAVGSDIEARMIDYSRENIEWLIKNFNIDNPPNFRLFTKDSRFITKNDLPEKIDAVITEGHLGNPLSKIPSNEEIAKIFRELANLHLNWLRAVHILTPKSCKIVMCVAAFRTKKGYVFLPNFDQLAQTAGYKVKESHVYDREDQIVAREIKVLEKILKT